MKNNWLRISAQVLSVGLLAMGVAMAEDAPKGQTKKLVNQTHCPVMGGKIDSAAYTDIQGQRVYHCCAGCSEKLRKDPDSYFKKAAEQGILFENIQTSCPVSGETLEDRNIYSDYEGRRIYFCCEKCQKKFAEKPREILKGMEAQTKEKPAPEHHDGHDHSGHGGH